MYEKGQGVPPDWNQAVGRYHRAADQGVYEAIYRLGEINRDGRNQPPDLVTAAMWFSIGSKMKGSDSQNALQALSSRMKPDQLAMAASRANTWWIEHPAAQQQTAGKPFRYDSRYLVGYPTDWPKLPPSTPQDRAYALQLTRRLESDPLSLDAAAGRS